jgi:ADP-heptose:LPS heptosyltransferase
MNINKLSNILISRTDSIGDVVLTLPLATLLKQAFPHLVIGFMGTKYTQAVIESCNAVDVFIDIEDFKHKKITLDGKNPNCIIHVFPSKRIANRAKQLQIPYRIGTINRLFHWLTCTDFVRLSRKNSPLHEAQLNLKLLKPFGIKYDYSLPEITDLFSMIKIEPLPGKFFDLLDSEKFKVILHPKSRGNGREWDLNHFISLVEILDTEKFQIFVSGTENDRQALQPLIDKVGNRVTNIIGQMTLSEFVSFIASCDGLIAASTGPVHVAAALQKHSLGIYAPMRPIHPGRWQPIGKNAQFFVIDKNCNDCRTDKINCPCTQAIMPSEIKQALNQLISPRPVTPTE